MGYFSSCAYFDCAFVFPDVRLVSSDDGGNFGKIVDPHVGLDAFAVQTRVPVRDGGVFDQIYSKH